MSVQSQYSVKVPFLVERCTSEVRSGRTDVGVSAMVDSNELRQQASRCRRLAFLIGRADVSHTLHELADEYELKAKAIEEDERSADRRM